MEFSDGVQSNTVGAVNERYFGKQTRKTSTTAFHKDGELKEFLEEVV